MSRIRISRNQLQVAIDLCQSGNSPASRLNLKILLLLTHIPPLALHRVARRVSCSLNHVRHVVGWVNAKDFQKLTRPGAFRKTRLLTRGQERQLARKLRNKLESAREVVTWSGNRLSVPAAYAWSKRLGHSFRRARAARRAALSSARKQGRQKAQRIKLPPEEIERLKQRLSFERQRMGLGDDEFRVYGPTHKPIRDDNPVLRLETIIRLGGSSDSVSDICTLLKCYPADVRRCQKRYIAVKGDLDAFCTPKRNGRPRKNAAPDSIGEVKVETDPSRAPAPCGAPAQGRDANLWLSLKSHDLARALLDRDLAGAGNPGTHALVFLQGVRGSGKTTLAKQLKNAAYFDCEAPETLQGLQAPLGFLRRPNEPIVIVDEIGLLQNRQEFFQAVLEVSKTKQILAISSSSKALEVSPALKWRVIGDRAEPIVEWDAESEPLGYCHIKLLPLIWEDRQRAAAQLGSSNSLEDALAFPGLPGMVPQPNNPAAAYLEWARLTFDKDVRPYLNCDASEFLRLLKLLASRSGELLALSEFRTESGLLPVVAQACIEALQAAGVIYCVGQLGSRSENGVSMFASDPGLVRYIGGEVGGEHLERLWKHFVLLQLRHTLRQSARIRSWRSDNGLGVDFVLESPAGVWTTIQCGWAGNYDIAGLRSFRRMHPEGCDFLVAPKGQFGDCRIPGLACTVRTPAELTASLSRCCRDLIEPALIVEGMAKLILEQCEKRLAKR